MRKIGFLILLIIILISCSSANNIPDVTGGIGIMRPKVWQFSKSITEPGVQTDVSVNTKAIYLHEETGTNGLVYSFFRFFPTGQVYALWDLSHIPEPNDYDSFNGNYGNFGYYRISYAAPKYVEIKMEFYFPMWGDCYHKYVGYLENGMFRLAREYYGDRLFFVVGPYAFEENIDHMYRLYDTVSFTKSPDW